MIELHKCSFKVDEIEGYRNWVASKKHIPILRKLGGTMKYLKEIKNGHWDFEIEIDTDNPEHSKIPLVTEQEGFHIQLTSLPRVTSLDALDTLEELKKAVM